MSNWSYLKVEAKQIEAFELFDFIKLPVLNGKGYAVPSRLDYNIQSIELPPVEEKDLENILTYKIRSFYPGNPDNTRFDYILQKDKGQTRAILFITDAATLAAYKESPWKNRLFCPLLISKTHLTGKHLLAINHYEWLDLSLWQDNMLLESRCVKRRGGFSLKRQVELFSAAHDLTEIRIVSPPALQSDLRLLGGGNVILMSYDEYFTARAPDFPAIFGEKKLKKRIPLQLRIGVALGCALLLFFFFMYKQKQARIKYLDKLNTTIERMEAQLVESNRLQGKITELEGKLLVLEEMKAVNVYDFLSALRQGLGYEVEIINLTLQDSAFHVEAVGKNPLVVLERLKDSGHFSAVKPERILPIKDSAKEKFSFSGFYHAE